MIAGTDTSVVGVDLHGEPGTYVEPLLKRINGSLILRKPIFIEKVRRVLELYNTNAGHFVILYLLVQRKTPPMPPINHDVDTPVIPRLRSGVAARLAGLPVATLRVWERRYGVVTPPKSGAGQRLYSTADVLRLKLLRQLTRRGHGIGTIATLELEQLRSLAEGAPTMISIQSQLIRTVVAVGEGAAQRLKSIAGCNVHTVYSDLDLAQRQSETVSDAVDILFVRLSSLQPGSAERVLALRTTLRAVSVVVIYAFGTESVAESLRDAGVTVRREPVAGRELARLIAAPCDAGVSAIAATTNVQQRTQRFGDAILVKLSEQHSAIACECLRMPASCSRDRHAAVRLRALQPGMQSPQSCRCRPAQAPD